MRHERASSGRPLRDGRGRPGSWRPPLLAVALLAATPAPAAALDGSDGLHLGLSVLLGGGAYAATALGLPEVGPAVRVPLATGAALLPGLAKELADPVFSGRDLALDLAGAAAGAGLAALVHSRVELRLGPREMAVRFRLRW